MAEIIASDVFPVTFRVGTGYGAKVLSESVKFGEGYEQEGPAALDPLRREWNIVTSPLRTWEAMDLERWLENLSRGGRHFWVNHPDTGARHYLRLKEYDWDTPSGVLRSMVVKAEEVQVWP